MEDHDNDKDEGGFPADTRPQAIPQNYKNEEINDKTNGNLII